MTEILCYDVETGGLSPHTSEADVLATEQIYIKMKEILGELYGKTKMVRTNP